jgi:hypothetical protein
VFMKNCFAQFMSIHKLGKFQWQPLNFMVLRAGDTEK